LHTPRRGAIYRALVGYIVLIGHIRITVFAAMSAVIECDKSRPYDFNNSVYVIWHNDKFV